MSNQQALPTNDLNHSLLNKIETSSSQQAAIDLGDDSGISVFADRL